MSNDKLIDEQQRAMHKIRDLLNASRVNLVLANDLKHQFGLTIEIPSGKPIEQALEIAMHTSIQPPLVHRG
jgi:hypothetical protein